METAFRNEMSQSAHFVQFCETDAFLINSLSDFIGTGLKAGDVCIVIATQPHRTSLEAQLRVNGLDLATACAHNQYISLDAATILSQFIVEGEISSKRFSEVVESLIIRAAHGQRHIRIFGEMVALLWAEGKRATAIHLEECWNDLADSHTFSLFCAYPLKYFGGEGYEAEFTEICHQHTQVVPAESYSALADAQERSRIITLLQQKALSLEAEIAERKRAEERLRLSENRYRRLFEASRDGILIVDPYTTTISDANSAITDLLGLSRKQLLGQDLCRVGLLQDQESTDAALQELQEKHILRYETELFYTAKDQQRALEVICNLYQENGRDVIQCNIRDITERKTLEQRKDEFISMASHELKTPVTSLKGFLTLLQRRLTVRGEEKSLHYLARMDAQVQRLTTLINDLLDLSRMQIGQLIYREEYFDVDTLLEEIVENVQGTTQTHHLLLEGEAQTELFADRDRIEQVLINLLNNAIKYSAQADTVRIHVERNDNQIHVSIQDFGIGIAKEYQDKIFEQFYQVTDPATKTYPGLGIGLYISCQIVRRHGGQLWVESEKGAGSTFHMALPLSHNV